MKRFDQINMIPFIDIMLVLLAIVLTTASFISQGLIPVDLPQTEQTQAVANSQIKPVEIAINAQNQLFIEGNHINPPELAAKLAQYPTTTPMILRVDKTAAFDAFIQVIDRLKTLHFEQVSIQTESAL